MNSEKEKLLNETYKKFLKVSMNKLPPDLLDVIVDKNIMAYGTAIDEKIHSLEDCRNLVDNQEEQSSGLKFKREIIPVFRRVSPEEDSVIFVDEMKMKIQTGKDTHRLFLRFTTILEYADNKWTVVHFHISKPDDTKGETDTWHIDEWKRKNEELQKLVDEKTEDLLIKNRELKIEASLERVRAIALGMKKSDDLLDICEALFPELLKLGFSELRNAMINIHNDEDRTFLNYDYSDTLGKNITPLFYDINPVIAKQIRQIRKGRDAFSETSFKGNDLKEWKKFRKRKGEPDDPRLKNIKALYYYFYSIGTGSIGISTFGSITKEKLELLKRFRNVFELAYRRYMDVAQAEAQAREVRIEIALERVRSRTMAMQKSDELSETTFMLFQQFMELGEAPDQITIGIVNEEEKVIEFWTTMEGNQVEQMVKFPIKETNLMRKIYAAWKQQKKSLAIEIKGEELHDYIDYRIRLTGVKTKNDHAYDRRFIQAAFFSKGMITISTNDPRSKETLQLLERFAGVFELTYTRFLDLKQAESQTREAKTELALERVRARSMAMHSSDELLDASIVLFNELKSLGIESIRTGVAIFDESIKAVEIWSSQLIEEKRNKILGVVPFKSHPFFESNYKAWKRKEPYFFYEIAGKEVKKYYKVMSSLLTYPEKKEFNPKEIFYTFFFPEGSLNVVSKNNLTEDECNLMLRFAKVFGMIYRRFLDLQKAEAQAKEAQIELALERVRARTMAMQRSDELEETSRILFQQFKELGEHPERITIGTINEDERQIELWVTVKGDKNRMVKVSIDEPTVFRKIYLAWKEQKKSMLIELTGKELKDYLAYRKSFGNTHGNSDSVKDRMISYVAFFSKGIISITPNGLLPKETIQLLERFAAVFDLTYTRFLDLKKAEEQAREAQIEVALERVRSRTMAMHKSDELAETAAVLFQQLCGLGIDALRLYIGIIEDENGEIDFWTTDYGGSQISSKYKASLYGSTTFRKIYSGWKEKRKSLVVDPKGKELTEHLYYLKEIMSYPIRDRKTLSRRLQTIAYFSKGLIGVLSNEELLKESVILLERFAGVFDLTYRRFLDLQKAEDQAHEAQIEVALERVRSRTMAMHSSDELQEAAILLFQQIRELGVDTGSCGYIIWENKTKDSTVWMSSAEGGIQESFKLPHTKSRIYKEIYSAKEEGKEFIVKEVRGAELKKHFDYLTTVPGIGEKIKQLRNARYKFPETIVYNVAFFKQGYLSFHTHELSPEAHDIFRRFANVFEQTYTRFLDLQKAEAQAREAQIQLALERVRAKAMAMQKSDELLDVSLELYNQFKHLDNAVRGLTINIINEKERVFEVSFGMFNKSFKLSIDEPIVMSKAYKCLKSGKKSLVLELDRKELVKFNKVRNTAVGSEIFPLEYKSGFKLFMYMAFFSNGMLIVGMEERKPESTTDILQRFASVFDLTYTRFLDLKKAEAQARESQIEAALEKIRSRSLAMHNAEELGEVISVVVEKLKELDFSVDDGVALITHIEGSKDLLEWMANPGFPSAIKFYLPYFEHPVLSNLWKAKNEGAEFAAARYTAKENKSFLNHIFEHSDFKHTPQAIKDYCLAADTYATSIAFQKNTAIFINDYSGKTLTQQEIDILKRFSKVFEQAYIRFLDLQKAEAQAKEAHIEAALERVRSRTMGMQKSEELKEVIQVIYEQLVHLNINIDHAGIIMDYKERDDMNIWVSDHRGAISQVTIPYFDTEHWNRFNEAKEKGMDFFAVNLAFKEKNIFYKKLFKYIPGLPEEAKKFYFNCPGLAISTVLLDNVSLYIENFSGIPYTDEENKTLMRFGKVFQQTYTRFLDLQKAEAQAKEAQIEAALERVRGKAMAMHNSVHLTDAAGMVFSELNNLGIHPIRSGFVLLSKDNRNAKLYPATSFDNKNTVSFTGEFEFTGHPVYEKQYESWQKKENYFPEMEGDLLKSYYKILAKGLSVPFENFPTEEKQFGTFLPFSEGFLFTWSVEPYSENEINILDRFKNILDLTIRRYIDLKKAEAQSRESQIEASLERVRSKAMAMQTSNDLGVAVATIFEELDKLDLGTFRCGIGIIDKERKSVDVWATAMSDGTKTVQVSGDESMDTHPLLQGAFDAWLRQQDFSYLLQGDDLKKYYEIQIESNFELPDSRLMLSGTDELKQYYYVAVFQAGGLFAFRESEFPDEAKNIIKRFADVINFTYTRFNDLKHAEAQARESQIEATLERVRASALIMRKPEDMFDVCKIISDQLVLLNVNEIRNTQTVILNDGKETYRNYEYFPDYSEKTFSEIDYNLHPKVTEFVNEIKKSSDAYFSASFEGKELEEWRDYRNSTNQQPDPKLETASSLHYYFFSIGPGALGISTYAPLNEDQINIFKRFRNVFELAYRRYIDIEQAEAQAREAQIEAALERVRSRTLAMQKSDELAETAAVVFKQLISLGIEPNRLYIGIIKYESGEIEFWITDEDGTRVSNQFSGNKNRNSSIQKMYDGWKSNQKSISIDMQGKELEEYFHHLSEELHVPFKQGLSQKRRVQSIAYFSHGFIGIASPELLSEETTFLLERFAAVFNLTYARFNDLKVAEHNSDQAHIDLIKLQTEKKRAEDALTELRATQAQLIQSEKMASLGELTAGIAHEIQNPLNFVNNFSEVNTELIEELNEEISKGNFEEAVLIAKDIKENEEKIKHHGKRAEGIVKGMLQHSRTSSGVKEPVNINALADEYLRLAYHGLRAKDKTFNAKMETDFDKSIGEINVVPQEIGRVILNLITNAFYAVAEKKKEEPNGYEPTVTVSTKKSDDKVLISVKDNGNGIPQKVMDKIFQPFFTTKPTGQGTGLGLSMSYDIIKAHGGELKVETKEGEGSEFVISIPEK